MALLNYLSDRDWWSRIEAQRRQYDEEHQEDLGSAASAAAQERYESGVLAEARAIVAGELQRSPTVEHLRIALEWLDDAKARARMQEREQVLDGETPF